MGFSAANSVQKWPISVSWGPRTVRAPLSIVSPSSENSAVKETENGRENVSQAHHLAQFFMLFQMICDSCEPAYVLGLFSVGETRFLRRGRPATWALCSAGRAGNVRVRGIDHPRSRRRKHAGRRGERHLARLVLLFLLVGFWGVNSTV